MPDPAEIYVIYNPTAGRGKTAREVERLKRELGEIAQFAQTEGAGHAETLAREAAENGYRNIGAAGGDGAVHETTNGILTAREPRPVLTIFPLGSANDFAHVLGKRDAWSAKRIQPWPAPRLVDVGRVVTGAGRQRFFINGMGLGFNCSVTHQARRLRFVRGIPLYTLALVRAMAKHFRSPELSLSIDGVRRTLATLSLTVLLGRREGNFLLAPRAILDDGQFDYLHVGQISRLRLLRYVPRMISGDIPVNDSTITTGRCHSIEVASDEPLVAHLDGELFCLPEHGERQLSLELLSGALAVALRGSSATI